MKTKSEGIILAVLCVQKTLAFTLIFELFNFYFVSGLIPAWRLGFLFLGMFVFYFVRWEGRDLRRITCLWESGPRVVAASRL